MSGVWEGLSTLCICRHHPLSMLCIISILSFFIGLAWLGIGVWLTTIIILNTSLDYDDQLFFEKLNIVDPSTKKSLVFENESSFVFTPLDNLKFYLLSMCVIAILGGLGRALTSLCLLHYVYKKLLPYVMSWAWVVLSILAVVSLASITVDTLVTLSHNDVSPPHARDFHFKNDHFGFYNFCHILKHCLIVDFVTICYFQWVVRWAQRHLAPSPPH